MVQGFGQQINTAVGSFDGGGHTSGGASCGELSSCSSPRTQMTPPRRASGLAPAPKPWVTASGGCARVKRSHRSSPYNHQARAQASAHGSAQVFTQVPTKASMTAVPANAPTMMQSQVQNGGMKQGASSAYLFTNRQQGHGPVSEPLHGNTHSHVDDMVQSQGRAQASGHAPMLHEQGVRRAKRRLEVFDDSSVQDEGTKVEVSFSTGVGRALGGELRGQR